MTYNLNLETDEVITKACLICENLTLYWYKADLRFILCYTFISTVVASVAVGCILSQSNDLSRCQNTVN